ncbi:hypothetical protein PMAYCL1PPCAC_30060, partial [Pristionchus mayeri]
VCPDPSPCPPSYSYNSYPTGPTYNGYAVVPNVYQPQPSFFSPAYNTYSTGYSSQPNPWYQVQPSYSSPYSSFPSPAYPPPSYGSDPAATKNYPSPKLPELTPLPSISSQQPQEYGYTANKIYRPVPEVNVPASTTAYEKPDEIIEVETTNTEYYPRMDKVTVEPYRPPVTEYERGDNEDHSTEVGEFEYKKIGGGTTPIPYSPSESSEEPLITTNEIGPTPSGYDSNSEPNSPSYGAGTPNFNSGNSVPEYPDTNTTPSSSTDYSAPGPAGYGSNASPPTDAAYSDVVYPIPPPSRRNAHFENELDKSGEVDERNEVMKHLKIRRASTPPPVPRTSSTCNSEKLGDAMIGVIVEDVSISKRRVAKATAEAFTWERFDVFCAKGEFSYSIHARKYCEVTKGDVTCFAFR